MLCNKGMISSSNGRIYIRTIELSDCSDVYLGWLNDERVNRFLETRWEAQSLSKIRVFVENIRNSTHSYLLESQACRYQLFYRRSFLLGKRLCYRSNNADYRMGLHRLEFT